MRNNGYFRMPTVSADTVVFVCEDDLWTVPLGGGVARRLTAGLGPVARPVFSPDGTTVAFTSLEEHHPEIYVIPAEGGQPTRLTFLGATSTSVGWTPDGRIVFRSDTGQPFTARLMELHAIAPGGGEPRKLPYGEAHEIAFGPRDGVLLGRNTMDTARWKRYRGGTAGRLWIDPRGTGRFRRLHADLDANIASPMWAADRVWFLSDHEGIGNVYSCRPDGRDLRRHTDHGEYYARYASTDGNTIVYQCGAELWSCDVASGESARIEVDFPSPRTQRNRKFVDAAEFLQGYAVHPAGHSVAVDTRGKTFATPLFDGPVREYGEQGARARHGAWLAGGERLVVVGDAGGEEALEVHDASGARRLWALDLGRIVEMSPNPEKPLVAVSNHRLELFVVDVDASTATLVDRSEFDRPHGLTWSADGEWLAYSSAETPRTRAIKVWNVAARRAHAVTRSEFRDFCPSFDPEGKYLAFLSLRTFDPVPDQHFFDLGFPRGVKPYLVTLRADVANPFVPELKGLGNGTAGKDTKDDKDAKKTDKKPLRIDVDGIADRVLAFPVPEGRYTEVVAIKGKALWTVFPVSGTLGTHWSGNGEARGSLESYDFATQKSETLVGAVSDFTVAADGATLVYRSGSRLRAVKAGERPDEKTEKDPPGRESGWIDLARVRVSVDPGAEWRQMYREAWRLQRDNFWTADMSGVDWPHVYERYLPLVDKVATRLEFSDLIWEMQGELGTSHAYEMFGDYRRPPAYTMGYLGADFSLDARAGRWRIEHIVRGDTWDEERTSPLASPGVNVRDGETLLAINGRAVGRDTPPGALLVNQAGQRVELTIGDRAGRRPRAVVVKTLRDEVPARYREWVERNRAHVHEATDGRAGYVHIPNMMGLGFSEFHRYYFSEVERDALVVDVRFNAGGSVSPLLLEKIARKRLGYDIKRWGAPEPYPQDSLLGPLVCLTNEHAGSDGDIFSHAFKLMKLGPLVGMRTWGGVIGIWPRHPLADGGFTTQPEFSFWFVDAGWKVENYGTDPDVEVDITPQDWAEGRDPQMAKGIELIARALRRTSPRLPDFPHRPSLALPTLPPRAK